jgi:hypothetical protein
MERYFHALSNAKNPDIVVQILKQQSTIKNSVSKQRQQQQDPVIQQSITRPI